MDNEELQELEVLRKFKKKIIKGVVIGALCIVVFLLIFLMGYSLSRGEVKRLKEELDDHKDTPVVWDERPTEEVSINVIEYQIQDIGELATVEYMYTDAGKFEDAKKFFNMDVIFTKKYFIAKWDGVIKCGIDLSEVKVDVNNLTKKITISLPRAKILSHEIDTSSVETLDEKDGLFNKVTVADTRKFDEVCKDRMVARVVENGLLTKAYDNAKVMIEKFVYTDAVKKQGYEIIFESLQ